MLLNYLAPLIQINKDDTLPYKYLGIVQVEQKKQEENLKMQIGLLGKSAKSESHGKVHTW